MKRKTIKLIILLISIALVGIIFSQFYWVNKAIEQSHVQFDNSARIATKSVVNQFLDKKNDTVFREDLRLLSCRKMRLEVTDFIEPKLLDSLLYEELKCTNLENNYFFGIYNRDNRRFVAGNYTNVEHKIINSSYQFSLSSIYKPGDYHLGIYFPNQTSLVIRKMQGMLLVSVIFTLVLIASVVFVVHTILKQKKLSEIKSDFINNLTHEFKTPIATTSLASEMLIKDEVSYNPERVVKYGNIIHYESTRLQSQVEQVLQVASLEQGSYKFKYQKVDIHELLNSVLGSFELRIKRNNATINTSLDADRFKVNTDITHITNVFYNLVDNAIKYSPENPSIQVITKNSKKEIIISFMDDGIGIAKEYQKDVFKNLF